MEYSRKIYIFDTTLRDGEQTPGCSMNAQEKLTMARQLDRLGVDIIEAGFPVSNANDFEAVSLISQAVKSRTVAALCRAVRGDIDSSLNALKKAQHPLIHIFIATSDLHMKYKLRMEPEEVLNSIFDSISYAKKHAPLVQFSCEDASRSDPDFLCRAAETAIEAGADIINFADTVGYAMPEDLRRIIHALKERVSGIENVRLGFHCHNDLGMAVANSLACIEAGVDQIDCTVNGIGERAGNASLEEIVMSLNTRPDHFLVHTDINIGQIYRTSSMLSRIIGMSIPPNKPVVGANAFKHESGIHQHGVMANRKTYEIMTPESIGMKRDPLVFGKHSGSHAFYQRVSELGYELPEQMLQQLFEDFKALAEKKHEVTDFDIEAMIENKTNTRRYYNLDRFVINSGNTIRSTSIIRLKDEFGQIFEDVATGDGPIFASYEAIGRILNISLALEDYSIRSVSEGGDALGEVSVRVKAGKRTVMGRGLSTDILESSIDAYLNAINKLITLGAIPRPRKNEDNDT
jgi:2-isopropylmalate synthase